MAGCGTVGGGVVALLAQQGESIARRCGLELQLERVLVRDPDRARPAELPDDVLTTDASALLAQDIDLVIEVVGGCEAARDVVLSAIAAGKPVVTANKALMAEHGPEVFAAAASAGVALGFEASCCGGVPIVSALQRGLIANRIDALYGIVNGTCNYILTEMLESRRSYANALADAQRLGYAEADPTLDVDGTDSAHKLAILAGLAFDAPVDFHRVGVEGIERLELCDLLAGFEQGYVCKLVAVARRESDGLVLQVLPAFMETMHPLA
ncbi:MAG: homoserine dehydrogenase, partial [bacterium]|nr:homoserine dehydrogenase [bacterium]